MALPKIEAGARHAVIPSRVIPWVWPSLAEACRNRTDPSRQSRDADGFEVRDGHQTPYAFAVDQGIWLSPKATKIVVSKKQMKALDRKGLQAGRGCSQLIRTKLVALLCSVCLPLSLTACGPKGHEQEGHQAVSRTLSLRLRRRMSLR